MIVEIMKELTQSRHPVQLLVFRHGGPTLRMRSAGRKAVSFFEICNEAWCALEFWRRFPIAMFFEESHHRDFDEGCVGEQATGKEVRTFLLCQ
jgi:hypothetical protein